MWSCSSFAILSTITLSVSASRAIDLSFSWPFPLTPFPGLGEHARRLLRRYHVRAKGPHVGQLATPAHVDVEARQLDHLWRLVGAGVLPDVAGPEDDVEQERALDRAILVVEETIEGDLLGGLGHHAVGLERGDRRILGGEAEEQVMHREQPLLA